MSEEMKENLEQNEGLNFDENISFDGITGENARVIELEKQVADLTDKYYRANADFENMRKRAEKEKADIVSYANEKFARDLLPVLDTLEMAVNFEIQGDEYATKIKEGILLTIDQFGKCLEKNGVTAMPQTTEFDPNFHNAMLQVESSELQSGCIVQVIQKGYLINGRVLRPAMVSIAK